MNRRALYRWAGAGLLAFGLSGEVAEAQRSAKKAPIAEARDGELVFQEEIVEGRIEKPQAVYVIPRTPPVFERVEVERDLLEEIRRE